MKDTRIDTICEFINDYYESDIKSKSRNASHIEARGMFLVIARRELGLKCSQLAAYLGMSESNIVRNHGISLCNIMRDKHIKYRFEYISKQVLKLI